MYNKSANSNVIKLRTIHNGVLKFKTDGTNPTGSQVKSSLCVNIVQPGDIMLISNGAEVSDHTILSPEMKYFALLRSTANRQCIVAMKVTKGGKTSLFTLSVPMNKRISELKRELCRVMGKEMMIAPSAQRLLARGQVLHDHCYIGDYMLTDTSSRRSNHTACSTPTTEATIPALTVYVTVSFDLEKEVQITFQAVSGACLKEHLSIAKPIGLLKELMWQQHGIPKSVKLHYYLLNENSGRMTLLSEERTLHDYNVESDVTIYMYPYLLPEEGPMSPVSVASSHHLPNQASDGILALLDSLFIENSPVPLMKPSKISNSSSDSKRRTNAKTGASKPSKSGGSINSKTSGMFGLKKGFFWGEKRKK